MNERGQAGRSRKPLIGVTTVTKLLDVGMRERLRHGVVNRRFGELIAKAGGAPVNVGPDADPLSLVERFDGFVINGGEDVEPWRYEGSAHPDLGPVDPERDEFEIALVRKSTAAGLPVLGVCRGMHVVNVAFNGSLIQHLPDVTAGVHMDRTGFDKPVHEVALEPRSRIAELLGRSTLKVNSVHHQSVDRPGDGLSVAARSDDGIVEAIEHRAGTTIAVQWHPEFLAPDQDPIHLGLFRHLTRAAG